jgi:hypothetical protein
MAGCRGFGKSSLFLLSRVHPSDKEIPTEKHKNDQGENNKEIHWIHFTRHGVCIGSVDDE